MDFQGSEFVNQVNSVSNLGKSVVEVFTMGFGHDENEVGLVDYFSVEKLASMT